MSQLSIVQDVCQQLGIASPVAVFGSQDPQITQLQALLNREGRILASRTNWMALSNTATFITVASPNQGLLTTIAPFMKFIVNDTIFNRTLRRPVFGPLSPQVWQQRLALIFTGPWNQFRVMGPQLQFIPTPTAGQTCAFEYVSKAWAVDATGATPKLNMQLDTDVSMLDEDLLTMGLIWRWKHSKGLDFTAEQQEYEMKVIDAIGRDGSKPILNMGTSSNDFDPFVIAPAGNWTL
jgi:hypothetical protein